VVGGVVGGWSGGGREPKNGANPSTTTGPEESIENLQENASLHEKRASYRTHTLAAQAAEV
jgi:hypothetical protein